MIRFIILLSVIALISCSEDRPQVTLNHGGVLEGTVTKSLGGRDILTFLSVPFAKPPVGDLRFKAPQPAESWIGARDASVDASYCTQRNPYVREPAVTGDEDCLYLAVYTPRLPSKSPKLLPVMVFLHGGGFMCGSGIKAFYGPDHLLDHDVVYIGVNYRLGPLGFMSNGEVSCPGNNGLKDQNLALKWIKQNIDKFGGDPNLVTLFGESAGGAATHYHMLSDLSKDLFQRGISQSGTSLCPWAAPLPPNVAPARASRLADLMGCSLSKYSGNWNAALDCLRTKPAKEVTGAFYEFFEWDMDPMVPFPPVVEPAHPGAFLSEYPRAIIARGGGWGSRLPWMAGITASEGAIKSAPIYGVANIVKELDIDWERVAPITLYYKGSPKEKELNKQIREFYFKDKKIDENTRDNVTDLFTDSWFMAGVDEAVKARMKTFDKIQEDCLNSNCAGLEIPPTYLYLFAHRGSASFTEIFGDPQNDYGVCHADELQYLFPVGRDLFPHAKMTKEDLQIVKDITTFWVNFAKTGNPGQDWRPLAIGDSKPQEFLNIGGINNGIMEQSLMEERARFWERISPIIYTDDKVLNANIKEEL